MKKEEEKKEEKKVEDEEIWKRLGKPRRKKNVILNVGLVFTHYTQKLSEFYHATLRRTSDL